MFSNTKKIEKLKYKLKLAINNKEPMHKIHKISKEIADIEAKKVKAKMFATISLLLVCVVSVSYYLSSKTKHKSTGTIQSKSENKMERIC